MKTPASQPASSRLQLKYILLHFAIFSIRLLVALKPTFMSTNRSKVRNHPEICPFCRAQVREHASTCGECGATKVNKASTLPPISVLFVSLIWLNCFGFIVLATGVAMYALALGEGYFSSDRFTKIVRSDAPPVCALIVSIDPKKVPQGQPTERTQRLYAPCENTTQKAIEIETKFLLEEQRKRFGGNYVRVTGTKNIVPVIETKVPLAGGRLFDVILAMTVLFAGVLVFKLAGRVWVAVFGRMSDLVWVRARPA